MHIKEKDFIDYLELNVNLYSIHSDNLNTPRQIDDISGNTVWNWIQYTFGSSNADVNGLNISNRFPGQNTNVESGFSQNWHREYNPNTGRYLQSDPIGLAGGLNTFSYVGNNPLGYSDQRGLDCVNSNGTVTCNIPETNRSFAFPDPGDWPNYLNSSIPFYHSYNIDDEGNLGIANKKCVEKKIREIPTPGKAYPATINGFTQNASPTDGRFGLMANAGKPLGYFNSPVKSYLFDDNGVQIIVNVTMPEHPLWPGYVARVVENGKINNYGEGLAKIQSLGKTSNFLINNIWIKQNENIICECSQ